MQKIEVDIDLHTLYDESKSQNEVEKVLVLDGQQRLQTLYCIYHGFLKSDAGVLKEAYLDITSINVDTITEQIYNLQFVDARTPESLPLFRVKDLLSKYEKTASEDISDKVNEELDGILNESADEKKTRERIVRKNISKLRSILTEDVHFWIEELDGTVNEYPYKTILEIFVRVNSGGTKLDASDLMFAAMKELSANIEENLEDAALLLSNGNINFEIDTILKAILLINGKGATVDPQKFKGGEGITLVNSIDGNWDSNYLPAFQALRDFIITDLKLDNSKIIRSYNSLVPILIYLYFNPAATPENKSRLKAFYYKAQIFNWFSSQTDGVLEAIFNRTLKSCAGKDFPLSDIQEYFVNSRHTRINFDMAVLEDHSLRFFFLHLLYVETNSSSAFNVKLKNNAPHVDHIYPKSKLGKEPLLIDAKDINHIGNYRLVGASDNIRKRAEDPESYFTNLKNSGISIQKHLLVEEYSDDPAKLKMDRKEYLKFKQKRTMKIFEILEPIINFV
ncbi:uncharacterized protein DUF262 [Chitinophaga dinghuensis]|uniref:Uncharacterized protein DUF262 n=2 Tax=Chitinophaga dinghuensis TaxID=1539050 RepID=A0A327VZN2_9BACT|nr:uncharacterized protein DUF262 [Chitinophaga dinghuensis]